jgi:choline-sulfatase
MTRQPNILFLISDEHSFRFLGHLPHEEGGEDVATPALDRLASQATVFTDAYCAAPICVPSRISLLTGQEAQNSGACDNNSFLDPAFDTIPKMLNRGGYTTCLVGKMHFQGSNQFHGFQYRPYGDICGNTTHQFEHFIPLGPDDPVYGTLDKSPTAIGSAKMGDFLDERTSESGPTRIPESQCVDTIVATETVAFLRETRQKDPDKPWFLCASFNRPHYPLNAPDRFLARYPQDKISEPRVPASGDSYEHPVSLAIRKGFDVDRIDQNETMRARAAYFANVSYFDEIIGDMLMRLDASDLLENTVIVYASDHGEMAGEHGTWWKSGWYEACTRVPFFVSTPEQRRGKQPPQRISTPVSLLDLKPTFAGLAGVDAGVVSGVDLCASITGKGLPPDRPVICDHFNSRWGKGTLFRAVRQGQYKLITFQDFHPLFFDLASDPDEQYNIFGSAEGLAAAERDRLVALVKDNVDFDTILKEQTVRQAILAKQFPLDSFAYLPNQYTLRSGRVIEADQTLYRQGLVTDAADSFFSDFPIPTD